MCFSADSEATKRTCTKNPPSSSPSAGPRHAESASPASGLPVDPSPFVGREAEMGTMLELLSRAQR